MREFKETPIGSIPSDWDIKTLDEIKSPEKKSIISGPFGSNISAKYFVSFGVPVIRGNNLSLELGVRFKDNGFVFITEEKANELGTWAIEEDIIFTAVGTIGQIGIIERNTKYKKYIISNKQLRIRVNKSLIEPLFAYYWIASPQMVETIEQRNTGSSVPLINLSVLKSLLIPIPSKSEREQITELLSSLDDKIDLLHRQNKTLEQLAETLFRQWFVEEAEESWEVGKVEDLFLLQRGFDLPAQDRTKGIYPIIASNGINGYHDEFKIKGPGVTTGRSGVLGKVIYTQEDFWPLNTTLFIKEYKIATPLFAYFFLKTLYL
jgi:type I restriction enzyme S subunit